MSAAADKVNILLVDDRRENLLALEGILRSLDQNLIQATSGAEALKYLLRNEAAVILLDVEMPQMDGFQTAALIRERDKSRHTPIIFLTAISKSDVHVSHGYSMGGVDYIFKPFAPDVLKSKVSAFVEMYVGVGAAQGGAASVVIAQNGAGLRDGGARHGQQHRRRSGSRRTYPAR